MIINQGFKRKREKSDRLPPGQYETKDFPVLSLGPTPIVTESDIDDGLPLFLKLTPEQALALRPGIRETLTRNEAF